MSYVSQAVAQGNHFKMSVLALQATVSKQYQNIEAEYDQHLTRVTELQALLAVEESKLSKCLQMKTKLETMLQTNVA